jgi:hypothetical protein
VGFSFIYLHFFLCVGGLRGFIILLNITSIRGGITWQWHTLTILTISSETDSSKIDNLKCSCLTISPGGVVYQTGSKEALKWVYCNGN